jgi:hypothetical protein
MNLIGRLCERVLAHREKRAKRGWLTSIVKLPRLNENSMNYSPIVGLIILVADVYAIVMIVQSSAPTLEKVIWSVVILLLPVIGVVVWFLAGPGVKPF